MVMFRFSRWLLMLVLIAGAVSQLSAMDTTGAGGDDGGGRQGKRLQEQATATNKRGRLGLAPAEQAQVNKALHQAAAKGDVVAVNAALAAGAAVDQPVTVLVNGQPQAGMTALMLAVQNGHGEVVRLLLAAGAAVNTQATLMVNEQPQASVTALMLAAQNGRGEVVRLLLAARAAVGAPHTSN